MPKGNKLAYLNSPMVDNTPIDYEENKNMIKCILENFNKPVPDLSNAEEVKQAINDYFNNCISKGLRPGNLGLYAALGLNKKQVNDLINGRIKLNTTYQTVELIKKACSHLTEYRELLGSCNKLSAPVLIFWQKNFDGLSDVQQVEIAAVQQATKSPEQIALELEDDIPET